MLIGIMMGCSSQKNTSKSRFWHSFNARYNTYYNGTLAYIDGSLEKEKGNKDNYTEILPLYTVSNKKSREIGAGNFDKAIEKCEKAIKLHSIKQKPEWTKRRRKTDRDIEWLNRKEYNPMMWKSWMLMGRSQFYKGDFEAASATFLYMSRLYQTQPAIYAKARAWLAKCYIEEDWMYDAEDVIRNISRDSIHWSAMKEWNYTYADYYIHNGDYAKAIPYLQQVIKKEGRKVQKAREYFLLGQLYAELGQRQEAYKAFKGAIRQNPPYDLEFNARIAMTEVMAAGQTKKMISRLKSMARNDNNKDYLDQVYYAMGNIYMAQRDTLQAISAYEKGNKKATRSGIEKGVLLLRLGDIYWDMEKYSDAGRCYGEAIGLLDKERKDYQQLADRSKKLDQLVPFTEAIHLQDSLLQLSVMPEAERNAAIDRVIEALKKKEKEERDREAERQAEETMQKNGGNQNTNRNNNQPQTPTQKDGQWYFYSTASVTQGKQAFQKQWGKRENQDHWNRMNKTVVNFGNDAEESELTEEQADSIATAEKLAEASDEKTDSAANDPHRREYYMEQIPFSDEAKEACHAIIMDGLYNSGVIFKDKLEKLELSEKQFNRLLTQYPQYEHMDNAYYHLFLLYSRLGQPVTAQSYVDSLSLRYPESQWTLLLTDPNFAENQRFGVHIEDSLYAATYAAFKADRHNEIMANNKLSAERFPLGANRDKFVFITGLSKLNAGDTEGCLEEMNTIVKKYPQSKLATMAGMIVNGVKEGKKLRGGKFDIDDVWARRQAVMNDSDSIASRKFIDDTNVEFVYMIAYEPDSVNENQLLYEMAKYNFTSYMVRNFNIEMEDQDGLHVMMIRGFRNYEEALEYAHQLHKQPAIVQRMGKARSIVISEKNRELLGVNFSYDDYDKFYSDHFSPIDDSAPMLLFDHTADEEADDSGSVPGNLSPILLKQQEEKAKETATDDSNNDVQNNANTIDEGFIIEDEAPSKAQTGDDGVVVIEDEVPQKNAQPNNDGVVIIEDEVPAMPQPNNEEIIIVEDKPAATPLPNNEEIIIVEDKPAATTATEPDGFIIEDEENQATGEGDIIIIDDEESGEGEEDEYFELEGF